MGKGSKSLFVKSANRNNNEKTKKKLLGFKEANDMAAAQKPQGGGIVNSSSSTKLQGTTKLTLCREDESTILKFLALLNHGESKLDNIIEDASSSDKDSDTDSDTDSDEYSDSGDSADVNRMVDDLCDNSKSEFNDRIFDSYENAPFANGMKSKERRKEAKEVESVPTEAFKRMLIRGDRFDSKAEVIADATHKQLTKVAIRNSVLTENNSKSFEDKINKSSNVESAKVIKQTAKRVGDKVRISVSCEKKSDTKVFVLSRSTTNEELLTQVRKKFNLTSASNMKKFNSFRVVLSLKKGLFEDFHDLSMLDDATHLQICHSHLGVSLPDQMEKQDIERTVEQDESVLVEKKDVPIELEVDEIEAEVVAGADALPAPPDAILNGVDAELPPPPPVYIRPLPSEEDILRSKAMKDSYNALVRTKEYQEILLHRCKLPIFEAKEQILTALKDNQVIVVCGETGSGKTTQLPTYVLDEMIKNDLGHEANIVCTQPRRIAAITVAERVSYERCETPCAGDTIGYQIRLQSKCGPLTKILHCTTGVLLRKILDQEYLNTVSHVIMDEVHERQVETDFLLALLKAECFKRPHLKLILMSATLQESLFSDYFGAAPVVYVSGRTHPVTNHYWHEIVALNSSKPDVVNYANCALSQYGNDKRDRSLAAMPGKGKTKPPKALQLMEGRENVPPIANNIDVIVETIVGIIKRNKQSVKVKGGRAIYTPNLNGTDNTNNSNSNGPTEICGDGILVFLSGVDVIEKVEKMLKQKYAAQFKTWNAFVVTLSGSQTAQRQKAAFKVTAPGEWKIVLSTNISETSVTVPDVTHVVDSGFVKEMRYEPSTNLASLKEVPISRASARQRAGRAGRVRPGHCWKLYSEAYHDGNSHNNITADAPGHSNPTISNSDAHNDSNARLHMQQYSTAEIKRIPLEDVILQILILKLGHPVKFLKSCLEVPSDAQIMTALENLIKFGAILPVDGFTLTPLGTHLARLPVDRHIGKMLIMGCLFKCIVPVLTIAAALCSSKSPFVSPPPHKREEASAAHRKFVKSGENSDLLATIHAYNAWVQLDNGRGDVSKFCSENYLNMTVLKEMKQLRSFFRRHLEVLGFLQGEHNAQNTDDGRFGDSDMSDIVETGDDADILRVSSAVGNFDSMNSSSSSNNSKVTSTTRFREKKVENMLLRCVIGSGLFPNFVRVCRSDGKDKKYKGKKGPGREDMRPVVVLDQYANHIFIHPSSMLNGQLHQLLLEEGGGRECVIAYHEKVATSKVFLRDCTCVPTLGVLLMCGRITINKTRTTIIAGGGWLKYKVSNELHAVLYKKLQLEINQLLTIKLENPHANIEKQQDQLIAIVKDLLL